MKPGDLRKKPGRSRITPRWSLGEPQIIPRWSPVKLRVKPSKTWVTPGWDPGNLGWDPGEPRVRNGWETGENRVTDLSSPNWIFRVNFTNLGWFKLTWVQNSSKPPQAVGHCLGFANLRVPTLFAKMMQNYDYIYFFCRVSKLRPRWGDYFLNKYVLFCLCFTASCSIYCFPFWCFCIFLNSFKSNGDVLIRAGSFGRPF